MRHSVCKAGKRPGRCSGLVSAVRVVTEEEGLPETWATLWIDLAARDDSPAVLAQVDDDVVRAGLVYLDGLAASLEQLGVNTVVDLCVVRSHEYYTGIAFEIDILTDQRAFVEVGGGRYDRLVGHFVTDGHITAVPATGWAFGLERLVDVLDQLGLLDKERSATTRCHWAKQARTSSWCQARIRPATLTPAAVAAKHRDGGHCVDVYVGDPVGWRRYASARGIAEHALLTPNED